MNTLLAELIYSSTETWFAAVQAVVLVCIFWPHFVCFGWKPKTPLQTDSTLGNTNTKSQANFFVSSKWVKAAVGFAQLAWTQRKVMIRNPSKCSRSPWATAELLKFCLIHSLTLKIDVCSRAKAVDLSHFGWAIETGKRDIFLNFRDSCVEAIGL